MSGGGHGRATLPGDDRCFEGSSAAERRGRGLAGNACGAHGPATESRCGEGLHATMSPMLPSFCTVVLRFRSALLSHSHTFYACVLRFHSTLTFYAFALRLRSVSVALFYALHSTPHALRSTLHAGDRAGRPRAGRRRAGRWLRRGRLASRWLCRGPAPTPTPPRATSYAL